MKKLLLAGLLASAIAAPAAATTISYTITDILPSAGYTENNVGQTFAGTGFVGVYSFNAFGHLLGLEDSFSRVNAQVGIAALAGATINSATISFDLLDNNGGSGTLTTTAYNSSGALGYQFAVPTADYGAVTATVSGQSNAFDVTSLVSAAVGAGEDWLGLHMSNTGSNPWTYTYSGYGRNPDSALFRLTVDYADAVPEPAMLGLFGLGALGLGLSRRRK